jgi:maltose alpha-D-glucosyltransferase/alpha-amylase
VDAHGRDVLLLGEAIQPVEEAAPYLADDELQGAFNFVLTAHLFAAIASGTAQKLGQCLLEAEQAVKVPDGRCRYATTMSFGSVMDTSLTMRSFKR